MKIAIAGKGGTGKTTIVGTMAREFGRQGHRVTAFDADPAPTLAMTVGIDLARAEEAPALPPDILQLVTMPGGERGYRLRVDVSEIIDRLGLVGPDGVRLVVAGRIEHAARGCNCGTHAAVKAILEAIVEAPGDVVLVDMEAGTEHLSRSGGTLQHADVLVVVVEPFYKSLVTGRQIAGLAAELGIPRQFGVLNKVRGPDDLGTLTEFCEENGLTPLGSVPWDTRLQDAESRCTAPLDFDPTAPGVEASQALARALLEEFAAPASAIR
ncbi:MAG: AAA family ATPase [Candidatus Dormibacteria bacterium]